MASLDEAAPEILISQLSWRSIYTCKAMIEVVKTIPPTFRNNSSLTRSSAGILDSLPLELLHLAFRLLDFQSLFNLARVSIRCRALVESLPAYRETTTHASDALAAINQTKLLNTHTAAHIHAALRSESCTMCYDYGPFIFLPTAERCCLNCLRDDPSLRVTTLTRAKVCFGVTRKDLAGVPIMRGIRGTYCIGSTVTHKTNLNLVSIKHSKDRGIAVQGSEVAMQTFVASKHASALASHLRKMATRPNSSSRSRRPMSPSEFLEDPKDQFCGMASTSFPSLKVLAEPEHGLWCLGCHDVFDRWSKFKILDGMEDPSEGECTRTQRLWSRACRAWSKSEFLAHAKDCQGASAKLKEINKS